jgi:hypothetical protein
MNSLSSKKCSLKKEKERQDCKTGAVCYVERIIVGEESE